LALMNGLVAEWRKLPLYFWAPNIIGYARVVALVVAMAEEEPGSMVALRAVVLSLALDYFDGPVARWCDMCTQFGDLLDHITDHVTMFWLVYVTSASPLNVWLNALHCLIALGYMLYYGCYFKHGGKPNAVCAVIEGNNYFNMPALLWNANTVVVPFIKMSYHLEHSLPLKASTELIDWFDMAGLLVTTAYTIAVCIPVSPSKADAPPAAAVPTSSSRQRARSRSPKKQ